MATYWQYADNKLTTCQSHLGHMLVTYWHHHGNAENIKAICLEHADYIWPISFFLFSFSKMIKDSSFLVHNLGLKSSYKKNPN